MFVAMLFLNFDGALVGFETRALVPKRRDLAWPPHTDLPILPSSVRSPRAVPLCALWSPPPGDFHGQHQVLCVSVLAVRVLFGSQRYIGKWLRAYQHFVWVRSFFAVFVHDDEPCAGRRPQPRVCTLCFVRQLGSDAEFFFWCFASLFSSHRPFFLFPPAFFLFPPTFSSFSTGFFLSSTRLFPSTGRIENFGVLGANAVCNSKVLRKSAARNLSLS